MALKSLGVDSSRSNLIKKISKIVTLINVPMNENVCMPIVLPFYGITLSALL